jgi:hypothetical protein
MIGRRALPIFGVVIGSATVTDAQELAEPLRGVDGVSPAATRRKPSAKVVHGSSIPRTDSSTSAIFENPRGFLPIPIVVTEPAVGYGGGAAGHIPSPSQGSR